MMSSVYGYVSPPVWSLSCFSYMIPLDFLEMVKLILLTT